MESPTSKTTPFFHGGNHRNESSSELAAIAEDPAPNAANTETNDFQQDILSPDRKSILRPALDGADPKQPEHDIGQGIAGQRSLSRTNTGESKGRTTRITNPSPLRYVFEYLVLGREQTCEVTTSENSSRMESILIFHTCSWINSCDRQTTSRLNPSLRQPKAFLIADC